MWLTIQGEEYKEVKLLGFKWSFGQSTNLNTIPLWVAFGFAWFSPLFPSFKKYIYILIKFNY